MWPQTFIGCALTRVWALDFSGQLNFDLSLHATQAAAKAAMDRKLDKRMRAMGVGSHGSHCLEVGEWNSD